ncbi:hypothetical protein LB559_22775 [Mesorhizobium sp. BR1-1-3]|uniref:Transmembrane protein n=1 Tax=Mesorhizobium ciceri biovar biserrulae (strain HAMBI 2942 / LMG 23838 / WSM1271) TaxID=765698 RepID=E8T9C7_MESCW|nr:MULTISPECIES: hypothetical protein [Mesorhizobium]ADV09502.1 hypothetical protein Mesci_0329 [Mesorhizobium ciceri biovar biserrulae WSM1271]MBZ9890754.1 hypothetical protein [Mesorhizobium sp. BR1-1-3]
MPDPIASPPAGKAPRKPGQAVVIVHGMGEQRPMDTLRGFVQAVWSHDPNRAPFYAHVADPADPAGAKINQSWITPDSRTNSYELRRITTPYDVDGRRTDFYELYWADITQGTTRGRLAAWVTNLLWRKPADIPPDARKLYLVTLVAVIIVLVATLALATSVWQQQISWTVGVLVTILASFVIWSVDRFGLPYFGDVAAYVRAEAATVEKRALIRDRGLKLLKRLMMDDTYDRIVLVSHSLGSMIAYDLLQILWSDFRPRKLEAIRDKAKLKAIHAIDKATLVADGSAWPGSLDDLAGFRRDQWELYRQLRTRDDNHRPWKISDFVTLGSPLTHSEFLVTHNLAEFRRGIAERLFSACPPIAEGAAAGGTVLYQEGRNRSSGKPQRAVHHGAVFAATRWTNIFDRGNGWLTGDPISGPMAENFGPGIENIQVELRGSLGRVFTHTLYWSLAATGIEVAAGDQPRSHLAVLRDAVDLGRKLEPSQAEVPAIPPRK